MSGNATLATLLLVLVVSLLALGAAAAARAETTMFKHFQDNTDTVEKLLTAADEVQALLTRLDPGEPDSFLSAVWPGIESISVESGKEETHISLTDLSSRFHINSLRKKMITGSGIREYLKPGMSADAFQQYRENAGFAADAVLHYADFFSERFLNDYSTSWNWWNINTADEFTLERIFALRSDDEAAARVFHARLREQLKNRKLISPDELEAFIGVRWFDRIFPVVNTAPQININTVDPWILKQLLSYEAFRVIAPDSVANRILSLRASRPIVAADLHALIPVNEGGEDGTPRYPKQENRLFAYLGATTWFWQIQVSIGDRSLERIIARLPAESTANADRMRNYCIVYEDVPW